VLNDSRKKPESNPNKICKISTDKLIERQK